MKQILEIYGQKNTVKGPKNMSPADSNGPTQRVNDMELWSNQPKTNLLY